MTLDLDIGQGLLTWQQCQQKYVSRIPDTQEGSNTIATEKNVQKLRDLSAQEGP